MEPRCRTKNYYKAIRFELAKFQALCTFSESPYNLIHFLRKESFLLKFSMLLPQHQLLFMKQIISLSLFYREFCKSWP